MVVGGRSKWEDIRTTGEDSGLELRQASKCRTAQKSEMVGGRRGVGDIPRTLVKTQSPGDPREKQRAVKRDPPQTVLLTLMLNP